MKWLKNLEHIAEYNTPGVCPHCGSDNTEYTANKIKGNFGNCVIWCNDCKHAHNISRIEISKYMITDKEVPNGLIF